MFITGRRARQILRGMKELKANGFVRAISIFRYSGKAAEFEIQIS